MSAPTDLRVEHLDLPLGITAHRPRLSWRLPDGVGGQLAYQVRVGSWVSDRVESDRSLLIPYAGPPLHSGQRVDWTVKVWTDAGESEWAQPRWWEMGLLNPDDWVGNWVEPVEADEVRARSPRPAYYFRHSFTVSPFAGDSFAVNEPGARARLYATAHGIYEFFLNGRRVGDMELTPGFTSYSSNVQVQTFDVTGLLRPGENIMGAVVSDGWYRGQLGGHRLTNIFGTGVALLAQLNIDLPDGSVVRHATGPDWQVSTGVIRAADLHQGQIVDLRDHDPGWCAPGFDPMGWSDVAVGDHDFSRLCASPAPPVRRVAQLRPVAVTRPRAGRQVVDLGQNINGWVRLHDLGPEGTTVTLLHGEALDADGDVTIENLLLPVVDEDDEPDLNLSNMRSPFQTDQVSSRGRPGESFEPHHTTHGFRYVRIDGHPRALSVDDVTGVVVHTDLRRTGWFECSDPRVNKLHEATVWSFRGNACDVPTDCPTRERNAWTGDWQIFVSTAAFLYDVAGFSAKWLRDLAAEQEPDGLLLHCAPMPFPREALENAGTRAGGSAGWGDASVIVPWEIYRSYGDRDLLAEHWPMMTAWVDYAARAAREQRHPSRVGARPTPAAHEEFIWDTGFHWGEWLEPGAGDEFDSPEDLAAALRAADHGDVATAYLHHSSRLLAEIARALGRADDEVHYRELASSTRHAWQAEFIRSDGSLAPDTQAAYVRALAFDLVPDELRPELAQRLVDLIRKAGTHLGTGFLATPYLLPVLADTGHLDVAYELLLQDSEPSWLAMIERGATTIWEAWNGIDERGVPHESLNHYSKGAVVSFLHRYVAGIRLVDDGPAYRHFQIAPTPGGGITWARAVHDAPYGRIESSWRVEGDQFTLEVVVPPGTRAQVHLPDGQRFEAQQGRAHYSCTI